MSLNLIAMYWSVSLLTESTPCRVILISIFTHFPLSQNLHCFQLCRLALHQMAYSWEAREGSNINKLSSYVCLSLRMQAFPRSPCFPADIPWYLIGPAQVTWSFLPPGEVRKPVSNRKGWDGDDCLSPGLTGTSGMLWTQQWQGSVKKEVMVGATDCVCSVTPRVTVKV